MTGGRGSGRRTTRIGTARGGANAAGQLGSAAELMHDLDSLITLGLVSVVKQVGGPTRYAVAARHAESATGGAPAPLATVPGGR
jgi:hypothetical protein